ncbi:hypothetical protein GDO86_015369 [Hymenochirus boettgeri]|uniref:Cytokine receptor-like factor 2-like D2 domain-containing protein n=1 Tax=Hymenochirus boettgeri TaxID=247094 RepID=A0A8T2JSP9_9PIPI|nr:hypothetical protein GDO86_015369 [Hymenochirus boettgeri]
MLNRYYYSCTHKTLSGVFSKDCVGYQVQHRTSDSDLWTVKDVTSNRFSFPSYNPDQLYIFQVRSKLNSLCASTKLWSDWSSAVTWGRNSTKNMNASGETFISAISIGSSLIFILILILVMLIRTDRIWVILVPQLPNPKKNFEDLYNMYNGNFQEWTGVSKEVVESFKHNYTEPLCIVSEDPECIGVDA